MKTQLLEDIDDSGALPLTLRARPAVWQRRRPEPAAAAPRQEEARPEPEPPAPSTPKPEPVAATMAQPDWLADILRQDAEQAAAARRAPAWLPRVLAWGVAACVLALLAAGGLWLFEERRADGALTVVAASSPAPAQPAARAMPSTAPVIVPAQPPPVTVTPVQAAPAAPAADAAAEPPPAATPAAPSAPAAQVDEPVLARVARRGHAPARAAAKSQGGSDRGLGEQRRREETLVQCQAHGYDEQQCVQRGCELTRYGLACRG